jgi:hypothetical protein
MVAGAGALMQMVMVVVWRWWWWCRRRLHVGGTSGRVGVVVVVVGTHPCCQGCTAACCGTPVRRPLGAVVGVAEGGVCVPVADDPGA